MPTRSFTVQARWDDQSGTWWTDGEDIPGLCCQASTFEALVSEVRALAPGLLQANGIIPSGSTDEIEIAVAGARTVKARLVA